MMSYTGLELFMEKLKQIVYSNDYPLIRNHLRSISAVRPQLQPLYEELHSTIQILFTERQNHLHELEEVRNLQKRFKEVSEEAHDRVDLFVSVINFKHEIVFPNRSDDLELSLNLRDIMGSIKSIKKEVNSIFDSMKKDSYPKTQSPSPAGPSDTRNSLGSNQRLAEDVVGLDDDFRLIVDKLVEYQKRLDVVSIVGTGGIGKTTLATKVFNDPFVVYHFQLRAWVTVSQNYEKWDLLIKILASIGIKVEPGISMNSKLHEILHKSLMGKRFLIVIDDIWDTKAWDDLKVFFCNYDTQSRILLTSRLKEVALYAKPDGLIHQLEYLTNKESWELLCKKVFHGHDCPELLIKPGMQIAKGCCGLPLALVVISGVLRKEATSKHSWERIDQNVTSYIVSDPDRHIETLALSIDHLPCHLRDCFLYLGGFPEDYKFQATRLIWLWVAEGFIQEAGNQSLEEIAMSYLMELADRNLVVVESRKFNGAIKTCSVHDVLRELCFKISTKEKLFLKKPEFDCMTVATHKTRRIFTDCFFEINNATRIRSLLFFRTSSIVGSISTCFDSWMLLMVLDLQNFDMIHFPDQIALLVHLRYLAIRFVDKKFPFTICNLRCLQTLIIENSNPLLLPHTISNLVNLRHLWTRGKITFPPIKKSMNLQRVSNIVIVGNGPKSLVDYFPGVKKLSCFIYPNMKYYFESLKCLELLTISSLFVAGISRIQKESIMFPVSLKKLTLKGCLLPWTCMSNIQSLPKLEVLLLLDDAFVGNQWDTGEEPFRELKLLKLNGLDIKQWKASSTNFPCLKQLVLKRCQYLEEIPLEIGYITTLERVEIDSYKRSVCQSVLNIQTEQHADGNSDIEIIVNEVELNNPSFACDFAHHNMPFLKLSNITIFGGTKPLSLSRALTLHRSGIHPLFPALRNNGGFFLQYVLVRHLPPLFTALAEARALLLEDLAPYLLETFRVPINRPTVFPASHHTCTRRWNDQRSNRRPIRRKLNRNGELRLLEYQD